MRARIQRLRDRENSLCVVPAAQETEASVVFHPSWGCLSCLSQSQRSSEQGWLQSCYSTVNDPSVFPRRFFGGRSSVVVNCPSSDLYQVWVCLGLWARDIGVPNDLSLPTSSLKQESWISQRGELAFPAELGLAWRDRVMLEGRREGAVGQRRGREEDWRGEIVTCIWKSEKWMSILFPFSEWFCHGGVVLFTDLASYHPRVDATFLLSRLKSFFVLSVTRFFSPSPFVIF